MQLSTLWYFFLAPDDGVISGASTSTVVISATGAGEKKPPLIIPAATVLTRGGGASRVRPASTLVPEWVHRQKHRSGGAVAAVALTADGDGHRVRRAAGAGLASLQVRAAATGHKQGGGHAIARVQASSRGAGDGIDIELLARLAVRLFYPDATLDTAA